MLSYPEKKEIKHSKVNGNSEIVSNVLAVPPEEASKITDENKTADKINKVMEMTRNGCIVFVLLAL